ncbi:MULTISPECIES: DUF3086 domain-containing protein [unclassified Moorena]|uniref:DUF3086 domain-containing protein n=1 Tax=unclassified Moorena TaxID=2683338 RepID=UPI0013B9CBF4|nr:MULTISPECIES: DUF3086 domain-containing protein [unclassified Moorena]NEP30098.1 DUF3086 domain-containing protein [Moorena sp. SIO3B2]NEQ10992.1 DUF3086 domain-containing protein [Moorena sp. SIO4E2]NET65021.1 DUF3086 domain-containing protein [Moorena sp. SIO1G6]
MNSEDPQNPEQEQDNNQAVKGLDNSQESNWPDQDRATPRDNSQAPDLPPISLTLSDHDKAKPTQSNEPLQEDKVSEIQLGQSSDQAKKMASLAQTVAELEQKEQELRQRIAALQNHQQSLVSKELGSTEAVVERMVLEGLTELEQRKQKLQISIEQLERRRERIREEMRTSFAGVSQELAIRVQGFKDYLVGSLQDLAAAAEQLELSQPPTEAPRSELEEAPPPPTRGNPKFAEQAFKEEVRQIRQLLDQYRKMPDYYGPPWQLRRTFEPIHAEKVSQWFFSQGGRGALQTMGSRLQNVLIASAVISVLRTLYDNRLSTLVLANTPERLGEWRRGLQDCLGISRSDFGPERGVVLFEDPIALVQKAERLIKRDKLALIIVDETEDKISLSLLQFPLWLAFAPDPRQMYTYDDY